MVCALFFCLRRGDLNSTATVLRQGQNTRSARSARKSEGVLGGEKEYRARQCHRRLFRRVECEAFSNLSVIAFCVKFGETKQIVIALVATTFKFLHAVAKTSGRIFGCKLCATNINHSFLNILAHTFPYLHIKSAPTEVSAQKRKFQLSPNKLYRLGILQYFSSCTKFAFYQINHNKKYCKKRV